MKRSLILFLLCASSLWGQLPNAPFSGTVTGSTCVTVPVANRGTVTFQVTGGTWTGTIQPQGVIGAQTAFNIQVTPVPGTNPQGTITANGTYSTVVAGFDKLKLCGATVTNTATITGNSAQYTARNGSIGSGGLGPLGLAGVGFPTLRSATVTAIPAAALASGENDIYTVPSGKRATIAGVFTNISGGSLNLTQQFKNASTYYKISALAAVNNNTQSALIPFNSYPILEAGESFSALTSGTGINFAGYVVVFDNTEPLSSPKILTLANGANTLYTCPAGSVCYPMNVVGTNAIIRCFNDSGGARTYTLNVVAFGGSPSTTNQINIPASTADQAGLNNTLEAVGMAAGDFININTTAGTATQTAYIPNMITKPAN